MNIKTLFEIKQAEETESPEDLQLFDFMNSKYGIEFDGELFTPRPGIITAIGKHKNIDVAVTDYNELMNRIKYMSITGQISKTSQFNFSKIKLSKSYESFEQQYEMFLHSILMEFIRFGKTVITEFNEFVGQFLQFILQFGSVFSPTKYLKSSLTTIFSSGLAFQIFEKPDDKDQFAFDLFSDPYFRVFENQCLVTHFKIDKHFPWVIIRNEAKLVLNKEEIEIRYKEYNKEEITLIQMVIRKLWIDYLELEAKEIKQEDQPLYLDISVFLPLYLQIKLKESEIHYKSKDLIGIQRFFILNTQHNGIQNTIKQISSAREFTDFILPQNRKSLYL